MKWFLIETGAATGKFNMTFDVELAQNCKSDEAYFRLYQWKPYCISLGANQKFEEINLLKAEKDKIDVVKRPTGGRAILHAEEITYSVVLPYSNLFDKSRIFSAKEIYEKISRSLIRGLEIYHPIFSNLELESLQPNFPILLKKPTGILCFGSTAKNEVKFNGKKLIGSAQRKFNSVILQHGSILCGTFHRKLADYINVDEETKIFLAKELSEKTIEIETITQAPVNYKKLSDCLINGFEEIWKIKLRKVK